MKLVIAIAALLTSTTLLTPTVVSAEASVAAQALHA
jgi:hypothetical protein